MVGTFFLGNVDAFGSQYSAEIRIPNIRLSRRGNYNVEFYVIMFCSSQFSSDCSAAGDSINFIIESPNDPPISVFLNYTNLGDLKSWQMPKFGITVNIPSTIHVKY